MDEEVMSPARARDRAPARPLGRAALVAVAWLIAASLSAGTVAAGHPLPSPLSAATSALTSTRTRATEKPSSVTFYGRGYGHGLGLSQYGARGRALAGQLAPEILAHYYEHTTLATQSVATPIRVLVVDGYIPTTAQPTRVIGRGGTWTVDGVAGTWPADASADYIRVTSPSVGWRLRIESSTGALLKLATVGTSVRIRPAATMTRLQVLFQPSSFDRYRGTIRLLGSAGGRVTAIDETNVEAYLRGVVPAEMPASWPAEALRAQAIAARSYATAHLRPSTGTWDIYGDGRSQVYRGVLGEQSASTAAIVATAGKVLLSGSKAINALFHSSDGGATEDNENVYVSPTGQRSSIPLPYLRGSMDRAPDGTAYDAASPHATWVTATYTYAQLSAVLASDPRTAVGDLTAIDLSDRGVSGRLISVTLTGTSGVKKVSGEVFRTVLNTYTPAADPYMWSTLFDIAPIP
jgi:stage II sporulation protein D